MSHTRSPTLPSHIHTSARHSSKIPSHTGPRWRTENTASSMSRSTYLQHEEHLYYSTFTAQTHIWCSEPQEWAHEMWWKCYFSVSIKLHTPFSSTERFQRTCLFCAVNFWFIAYPQTAAENTLQECSDGIRITVHTVGKGRLSATVYVNFKTNVIKSRKALI